MKIQTKKEERRVLLLQQLRAIEAQLTSVRRKTRDRARYVVGSLVLTDDTLRAQLVPILSRLSPRDRDTVDAYLDQISANNATDPSRNNSQPCIECVEIDKLS